MKRIVSLLVIVIALFAVTFAFAQDDTPTIAEIVVASTEADSPEFTTLLAAVGLADEAVLTAISDPEAELTVFAPTDAAFAALAEALGEEAFNAILEDTATLTDILLFHVVDGAVMSSDVVGLLEENEEGFPVTTLNGQFFTVAGNTEDGITINEANLVLEMVDIEASNGVIHVIDAVIVPETRSIAEIVVESAGAEEAEFTTLLAAVGAADPGVLELLSDADADLTVFAPTDAAFEALGEDTIAAVVADQELVSGILGYHVVVGRVFSADIPGLLSDEGSVDVEMATGDTATISADDMGVFINDAEIIIVDIQANNGVIHVIDAVLLPPSDE